MIDEQRSPTPTPTLGPDGMALGRGDIAWMAPQTPLAPKTNAQQVAYIESVSRERDAYKRAGDVENVAACEAEIARAQAELEAGGE
jgi:hypothetical protein